MSEMGGGRCGRCGTYIHGKAVELNGWWLHEECAPVPDVPECPSCGDPITDGAGVYVRTDGSWRHEDCFPEPGVEGSDRG